MPESVAVRSQLVALTEFQERNVILAAGSERTTVRFCATPAEVFAATASRPQGIVWDVRLASPNLLLDHLERFEGSGTALLFRVPSLRLGHDDILGVSRRAQHARVSVHGFDDLGSDARHAAAGTPETNPQLVIIHHAASVVPPAARLATCAAAVLGARRASVADLAALCGISVRTLEWRLRSARMMTARRLLRWMMTLHATWHLDVRRSTPKSIADGMRFASTAALYSLLARQMVRAPTGELRRLGFHGALARFLTECRCQKT